MHQSVVTLVVILATIPANAQTPNHAATSGKAGKTSGFTPARTADGHPDLQGVWTNDTNTPLERPPTFASRAFFEASEEATFAAAVLDGNRRKIGDENFKTSGDIEFLERGKLLPDHRTAFIIDPPNGALPPLLPPAQLHLDESQQRKTQHIADGPEDFDMAERCISWPSPPMLPQAFNAEFRIVQTRNHVVIHTELLGEARVIPLDGRPHLPSDIRQWKGDSRGSWEGQTLVVETMNFRAKGIYHLLDLLHGSDESLHVIERFSSLTTTRFCIDSRSTIQQLMRARGRQNCRLGELANRCSSMPATKATTH